MRKSDFDTLMYINVDKNEKDKKEKCKRFNQK